MKAIFRTIFCILSVACLAVAAVIGMIFGLVWALVCIAGAAIFAGLMFLMKRERRTPEEHPDFMKSKEENRAINQKLDRYFGGLLVPRRAGFLRARGTSLSDGGKGKKGSLGIYSLSLAADVPSDSKTAPRRGA